MLGNKYIELKRDIEKTKAKYEKEINAILFRFAQEVDLYINNIDIKHKFMEIGKRTPTKYEVNINCEGLK